MDSREILDQFANETKRQGEVAKFICGTGILDYEGECGIDLIHFTDQNLFDYFIIIKQYYRLLHVSKVVSEFGSFYNYCIEKGLIKYSPFYNSILFTQEYLIDKIAAHGNIKLYTKEYIDSACREAGYNYPYYLSICLALYEGVQDLKTLASIKYEDVDFVGKTMYSGGVYLPISDDLINAIKGMYAMDSFYSSRNGNLEFYDENSSLIRDILKRGSDIVADDAVKRSKQISNKIISIELEYNFINDSGVINRLINEIGKERLIEILEYDPEGRTSRYDVDIIVGLFKQWGIKSPVKNFVFNYKVYAPLLKTLK
ncbi:hypothetical protein K413DRAFT_4662 [Clostridium sp. ASBs410]|nr:hypothetical protein K413DRAFT_4662 [Clostridium sp. ASBs410]